jgi:diguanylate cyclase (GGDEF)-like protein
MTRATISRAALTSSGDVRYDRRPRMKDPFKTGKMPAVPLPAAPEPAPSKPASSSRASPAPLSSPASSEGGWRTGEVTAERTTDPVLTVPATDSKDRATLTVLTGIGAGQVFALDGTDHVIGRGTEADLWVEDGGVSRRHARISCRSDGRYFIEDLGSTNGTFLGAQRVDVVEIRTGDRIQLGPHVILRFAITDDAEEELQRRLYESSTRDALTRVYNRKYFNERLTAEVAYSRRHKVKLAVMLLDLDDFKAINDTYGHLAGDMVLRIVSAQIQRLIRVEDLLARYGGEEFVILARSTGKTEAERLAERIRQAISELEIVVDDRKHHVSLSIGVAALPDVAPEGGAQELLALADARLYRAKADGKNRVCSQGER